MGNWVPVEWMVSWSVCLTHSRQVEFSERCTLVGLQDVAAVPGSGFVEAQGDGQGLTLHRPSGKRFSSHQFEVIAHLHRNNSKLFAASEGFGRVGLWRYGGATKAVDVAVILLPSHLLTLFAVRCARKAGPLAVMSRLECSRGGERIGSFLPLEVAFSSRNRMPMVSCSPPA